MTQTWPWPGVPWVVWGGCVAAPVAGAVAAPAAGAVAEGVAVSHDLTPPCPRHAPDRVVPEKAEPSLQVAVTVAFCACATGDNTSIAAAAMDRKKERICLLHMVRAGHAAIPKVCRQYPMPLFWGHSLTLGSMVFHYGQSRGARSLRWRGDHKARRIGYSDDRTGGSRLS